METLGKLVSLKDVIKEQPWIAFAATSSLLIASSILVYISSRDVQLEDARKTDPAFLKKHSRFRFYYVFPTKTYYFGIRVFYHEHPKATYIPKSEPLPLLVFVHGLGGSVLQYQSLLSRLTAIAPCLAIDLPGCGCSELSPSRWTAYSSKALTLLLCTIVEAHRDKAYNQKIILIGHSYGCGLIATMASQCVQEFAELRSSILGVVALCPALNRPTPKEAKGLRMLLRLPSPLFDLLRAYDRRGGLNSTSVTRATGVDADIDTKKMQIIYNKQSRTPTFRRIANGSLPESDKLGEVAECWQGVEAHALIIAGESDNLTKPQESRDIEHVLQDAQKKTGEVEGTKQKRFVEMIELPSPASHTLLFSPSTVPVVSGLIQTFLVDHIDRRLSAAWQLTHLSANSSPERKWEMKNLTKWQNLDPVSKIIAGEFRGMKTMRENDEIHSPLIFAQQWRDSVGVVVDISHESPSYDPRGLESNGIEYRKFPTRSKKPPSDKEVEKFIKLIDGLREGRHNEGGIGDKNIVVHCHYGFNRTGYFIVCYLVERLGWKLQDAINEFERARPPGIKHGYFVDTLFVRYYARVKFEETKDAGKLQR